MKFNIKSLLKDTNVLYVILFLAVSNLFGYMLMREVDAVIFFLIVGFLTSYFSKNMIVVMLVAIISTNLLLGSKYLGVYKEGFGNDDDLENQGVDSENNDSAPTNSSGRPKTKNTKKKDIDVNVKEVKNPNGSSELDIDITEPLTRLSPAPLNGKKPKLDYAGTMETAYDNLDNLLSSDALKHMGADTQRLAEKQKLLMNNINKLEPVMQKASKLLESLDMSNINGMVDTLTNTLSKFGGGNKK